MQLDKRIQLLLAMEKHFDKHDSIFFEELLKHEDYVIRTRAVCIMAEIAGEKAVELIGNVLLNDVDHLVRHEAAIALGVIGSEESKNVLEKALNDEFQEVQQSALVALANIDYISYVKRNNKFTKMTGG